MRSILEMKDYEAITIANLAFDEKLTKPVVIRTKDETIDLIIVADNRFDLELNADNIMTYQSVLLDWIEIDSGFNVKEKHNTCCNMVEIYSYLQSKLFYRRTDKHILDRMESELYLSADDVA